MNPEFIPQMVTWWVVVNAGALILLAVMSYVSGKYILDGLEALDRWISKREANPPSDRESEEKPAE